MCNVPRSTRLVKFISKATKLHKGKYDYSRVHETFERSRSIVLIGCPIHGWFKTTPGQHLVSKGCKECMPRRCSVEQRCKIFIEKATKLHKGRYDYSRVHETFKDSSSKIKIGCNIHGFFTTTTDIHLQGSGCKDCTVNRGSLKTRCNNFITKANKVHNNKYGYIFAHVHYFDKNKKIPIMCWKHGTFEIPPASHLRGGGCPNCTHNWASVEIRAQNFIDEATRVHRGAYEYKLSDYKSNRDMMKIYCKACKNVFEQAAYSHLRGCGCSICSMSSMELIIFNRLKENNIKHESEKSFPDLRGKSGRKLRFDFYLPDHNTCIECDGEQHFKWVPGFMTRQSFDKLQENDKIKDKYCHDNGIRMIRLTKEDFKPSRK